MSASPETRNAALDRGLRCGRCGYNLTGLSGSVCPECGTELTRDTILEPGMMRSSGSVVTLLGVACVVIAALNTFALALFVLFGVVTADDRDAPLRGWLVPAIAFAVLLCGVSCTMLHLAAHLMAAWTRIRTVRRGAWAGVAAGGGLAAYCLIIMPLSAWDALGPWSLLAGALLGAPGLAQLLLSAYVLLGRTRRAAQR